MPIEHLRNDRIKSVAISCLLLMLMLIISLLSQPAVDEIPPASNSSKVVSAMLMPLSIMGIIREDNSTKPLQNHSAAINSDKNWYIYFAILLLVLYIIRRYELSRVRLNNKIRIATIESEKLKELDQLKSKFFTNISHEFRTPLTLIKGPLEQLIAENADPKNRNVYGMMHNNASRLLELINQLLDLSKIESGNYRLKTEQADIVEFVERITNSYTSLAFAKTISLEFIVSPELLKKEVKNNIYFDYDILDKIFNNILSNAFKFTQKEGRIIVSMKPVKEMGMIKFLEVSIEDTGIGIDPDKLPFIFDRYYQIDHSIDSGMGGSGVGLSIVNELIQVHKGNISVQSTPGFGSVFRVHIPYGKSHLLPSEIDKSGLLSVRDSMLLQFDRSKESIYPDVRSNSSKIDKPWVLVVDDHEQVRRYIIDLIHKDYRILQAEDGSNGFKIAQDYIPDLIVSDVMMPGIDGFQFCEQIKNSEKTCHIPIILLTAKGDMNNRIVGLKIGADDYLTKPFNAEELRTRISNLIENRNALRKIYSSNSIIKPAEISVSSQDALFIELLLGLIEKNMSNIEYSVDVFSKDAGFSQSQLHRKLRAIINMSPNQFITSVRLHRAMELLQNDVGNIAEIANMVGYDDPGYFSKAFRKFFDKLPSEILKQD